MTSRELAAVNRKTLIIRTKGENPDWADWRVAQEVGCSRAFVTRVLRAVREPKSHRTLAYGPVAKPEPLSPLDELDRLTAAGWGDVPQKKIPVQVLEAAQAGRLVPRYPAELVRLQKRIGAGEDPAKVLGGKR